MGSQDDARSGTKSGFDNANNVGHAQTAKERPQREVLKSSGARWKIVNQRVIFHVDSDEIIQTRSGKVENPRNLLGVEKIGRLVPVLQVRFAFIGLTIHMALR